MKVINLMLAGIACTAIGATSCGDASSTAKKSDFKFIDPANMDTTVSPAENFFWYAGGTWLKNTEMPGDETRWGSFDMLRDKTNNDVHTLLEEVSKKSAQSGSKEQMVGDLYKSGMDSVAINQAGIAPLQPVLDRIDAISSQEQLMDELATQFKQGIHTVISGYVSPDD